MSDSDMQTGHIGRDTGGLDENGNLMMAGYECYDCGLSYSWPVTPGLAASEDPLQVEMLALVKAHTPAVCRAAQAVAVHEQQRALSVEAEARYDRYQSNVTPVRDIRLTVSEAVDNERDGYPTPVDGDPLVTLQEAIDRGAVIVSRGLPETVLWRRANPGLGKAYSEIQRAAERDEFLGLWPALSHQALSALMRPLAKQQRRLTIGGVLRVAPDRSVAGAAS